MQHDRPSLGILLMLGFCILIPTSDAIAKLLGDRIGLIQLLFMRFFLQAAILLPLVLATGRSMKMDRRITLRTVQRTVLHILGVGLMYTALMFLPLADTTAIAFVMPFISLLLGYWFLNETVGPRRLIACLVGFGGTMMVIQPAFATVGWPAMIPLGVALNFALFMMVTRTIAKDVDPVALQVVSGAMACGLLGPLILIGEATGIHTLGWTAPEGTVWLLILTMGAVGTIGHLAMTWSLRYAPSATLAPMQYLEIPFAALTGWFVFRDWPNALAQVGIAITISAGLYVMYRERATSRKLSTAPRAPVPVQTEAE